MRPLRVGSLFSGIGGFDLGLERAGMRVAWQVEIDPACQRVLRRRFPDATLYDDITRLRGGEIGSIDVLVGGFPCQDLSVAGRRAGLKGERSGLYAAALVSEGVRRLTPRERERLQGFPDDWTEGESDSARDRMTGNAVCVPVAEWIGRRLVAVHDRFFEEDE